jgi:hypothetical protein
LSEDIEIATVLNDVLASTMRSTMRLSVSADMYGNSMRDGSTFAVETGEHLLFSAHVDAIAAIERMFALLENFETNPRLVSDLRSEIQTMRSRLRDF